MPDIDMTEYRQIRAELDELNTRVDAIHSEIDKIEQKLGR